MSDGLGLALVEAGFRMEITAIVLASSLLWRCAVNIYNSVYDAVYTDVPELSLFGGG